MVSNMSIFEDKKIRPFCARTIMKKGLEKRVLLLEIMGHFFHVIYVPLGNFGQSFSLIKFFSRKLSNSTGLPPNSQD